MYIKLTQQQQDALLRMICNWNRLIAETPKGYKQFNKTPFRVKVAVKGSQMVLYGEIQDLIDNLKKYKKILAIAPCEIENSFIAEEPLYNEIMEKLKEIRSNY